MLRYAKIISQIVGLFLLTSLSLSPAAALEDPSKPQDGIKGYIGVRISGAEGGGATIVDTYYGPAFASGLQPGDIIREVDSIAITTSRHLISELSSKAAGDTVSVGYVRGASDALSYKQVVLARRPIAGAVAPILGMFLGEPSDEQEGLAIERIMAGSIAARSNLNEGDRIVSAYGESINTMYDFLSSITKAIHDGRSNLLMQVVRDSTPIFSMVDAPKIAWLDGPPLYPRIVNYSRIDWVRLGNWTIHGKETESGKKWKAHLNLDGLFELHTSNYRIRVGKYRIDDGSLCIHYPPDTAEVCRTPKLIDHQKVVWFEEETDSFTSEVVSIFKDGRNRVTASLPVAKPVVKPIPQQPKQEHPKACRDTSSFCARLSLGATACGWVGQGAIDEAIGFDSGPTGSAVSGAACQAIVSDLAGLDVDLLDLVIATTSSALLGGAMQSLDNGDIFGALLQGALGASVGMVGVAKCEATLEQACR